MMDREKAIDILQRMADDKTEELHICDDEGGSVCGLILEEQNAILAGIEALEDRPHGEWEWKSPTPKTIMTPHCNNCGHMNEFLIETNFCPNCGASMQANGRKVTGKLNEEHKDSHAEYWNSIGEWKEGEVNEKT